MVDLRNNFGAEFSSYTIELKNAKEAEGTICKLFTYCAEINMIDNSDKVIYEKCVKWRQKIEKDAEEREEYEKMKEQFSANFLTESVTTLQSE